MVLQKMLSYIVLGCQCFRVTILFGRSKWSLVHRKDNNLTISKSFEIDHLTPFALLYLSCCHSRVTDNLFTFCSAVIEQFLSDMCWCDVDYFSLLTYFQV